MNGHGSLISTIRHGLQTSPREIVKRATMALPALPFKPAAIQPLVPLRDKNIIVQDLVKTYHTQIGRKRVLDGISFDIGPGDKIAVLGKNGAGKSTLVKVIGGVELPTAGLVHRGLFMSWPIGFAGGFEMMMSGMDNIRFLARLYHRNIHDVVAFVDDFAELGRNLYLPVRDYSSGMRMRLAFALSMAINFECFLIDEVLSVGDRRFQQKCHDALFVHRVNCAMILVSHDQTMIRQYCRKALVLKAGRGRVFDDLELAIKIYETL
ncbi:MAG TPA: ATP-binding cassette domain-containing protein [Methylocella sp.]|nr:ATP-binding cassette domain-containing protein [Methylocella sp.]